MKNIEVLKLQKSLKQDTNSSSEKLDTQAILELLSTEPPKTINVIEMITMSGAHHCSGIQIPSSPELIDKTLNLSDI
ncbi:MAG TPA: hypothetical protein DCY88_08550 [Cyanobacteria bacterium UBA11372]|nr:hypothetical protein [Cyanobacteria bacterium UBA11372]